MDIIKAKSLSNNNELAMRSSILNLLLNQSQFSSEKIPTLELLTQEFEIHEYELGEQIVIQSQTLPNSNSSSDNSEYFFLICEGRVRLLGFDVDKKREASANLLLEGEIFGAHSFWYESPLSYKVQAASKVQVARITLEKLKPFLKKLPELALKWRIVIHEQQKLIFFKTLTELRYLSSQRLKQLLP